MACSPGISAEPYAYHLPMEMHEGILPWAVHLSTGLTLRKTDSPSGSQPAGGISLQVCAKLALWLEVGTCSHACSRRPLDGGRTTFGAYIVHMDLRLSKGDGISLF